MSNYPKRKDGPPSGAFVPVVWRGTTSNAVVGNGVGISFDSEDGSVVRLMMTYESAKDAAETLFEAIQRRVDFISAHPDSSSGNPSVDVSTPVE